MDRFYNSKKQSMTNYLDIFKACRLCGSGGGYKMPIIQKLHVDDVIDVEAELKQKIRECVSIDVHPDDRMPPLICELCVDKVNDFYEFREMCRATNTRVRASLGLPPQNLSQDFNEDCILGVTGPLFHSSNETDSKKDKKVPKKNNDRKSLRSNEPTPPILDRSSRRRHTDSPLLGSSSKRLRFSSPSSSSRSPLPERRKSSKGTESLAVEARRLRDSRDKKQEVKKGNLLQKQKELLAQKAKEREIQAKEAARLKEQKAKELRDIQKAKESQRARDIKKAKEIQKAKDAQKAKLAKQAEQKAKEAALKKKQAMLNAVPTNFKCDLCTQTFPKQIELMQHTDFIHTPLFTDEKLSCTPCGEWFASLKDADAHHKWHKTSNTYYNCQRCATDFKVLMGFNKHFQRKQCIPYETVPDVKCTVCMGMFATENWMRQHKCPGPPKDMCKKCMSVFQGRPALQRHERRCKGIMVPLNPDNPYLKEIRPLSIRMDRCDNLIRRIKTEPGLLTSIKQEPMDFEESTIHIKQEIKQEMEDYNSDYGGYGGMDDGGYSSDGSVSETETHQAPHLVINPFARKNPTQVESLSIISLRSIFGGRLLGKQRTRRRKKKNPKLEMLNLAENSATCTTNQTTFDSLFDNDTSISEQNRDSHDNDNHDIVNRDVGEFSDDERNHDEIVTQNVINDIIERTAEENNDSTNELNEEKTEHTHTDMHVQMTSQEKNDAQSEMDVVSSSTVSFLPTKTKTFVEGFALDPEVEALLMEDEEITTNDSEALNSEINKIIHVSELHHSGEPSTEINEKSNAIAHNESQPQIDLNISQSIDLASEVNISASQIEAELARSNLNENVEDLITNHILEEENIESHDNELVFKPDEPNRSDINNENKKSDDVMDLISDSGDDCNILDSPDKSKHSDDHLLEDEKQTEQFTNVSESQSPSAMDITESQLLGEENEKQQTQQLTDESESQLLAGETQTIGSPAIDIPESQLLDEEESLINDPVLDDSQSQLFHEHQSIDTPVANNTKNQLLDDDKQIDEETLLTGKDEGNIGDTEITQQDEDLLLGRDDHDTQTAQIDHDLEKISDGEFDID